MISQISSPVPINHGLLECSGPLKPMSGKRRVRIDSSARISSKALLGSLVRRFSRSSQPSTSSESLMVNGLDLGIAVTSTSGYMQVGSCVLPLETISVGFAQLEELADAAGGVSGLHAHASQEE